MARGRFGSRRSRPFCSSTRSWCDTDDELVGIVDGERDGLRREGLAACDERHVDRAAERWRLRVEQVRLVRLGGQVDRGPETRSTLGPTGQTQFADHRRTVRKVLE